MALVQMKYAALSLSRQDNNPYCNPARTEQSKPNVYHKRINIPHRSKEGNRPGAKINSNGWFRSSVLRVMSPARFRCATLLNFPLRMRQLLDNCELILLYKIMAFYSGLLQFKRASPELVDSYSVRVSMHLRTILSRSWEKFLSRRQPPSN